MRPLYAPFADTELTREQHANTGLWYDKFCNTWPQVENEYKWTLASFRRGNSLINPKHEWLATVTGHVGSITLLAEACTRQRHLVSTLGSPDCVRTFKTIWRFVTGLGRHHPIENGFAWHHTLGVPYLPGSSVKGMVRAWVEQWMGLDETKTAPIFGSRNTSEASAGKIIFLDALPPQPIQLEEDVMTPHYGPYYQDGKIPGDWYDPVPIPFLTVADGQPFQFAIIPRFPGDPISQQCAEKAMEWLEQALNCIGAGAKTAVGYERFQRAPTAAESATLVSWEEAAVKHTPNDGQWTVTQRSTGEKALCPEEIRTAMKKRYAALSTKRQKLAKRGGLPCSATVMVQGNSNLIKEITVSWTGEDRETYRAQQS